MSLEKYLREKLSGSSVKIYLFEINHFISYLGEERSEQASHAEVLNYVNWLRSRYENGGTIHRIIQSIKQYFFYLIEVGKRADHPCRYLKIRDQAKVQVQLQDLLSGEELANLLKKESRRERYTILSLRNELVMSLLVNQGLRVKEICNLKLRDLDLEKGTIYIESSPNTNARKLSLQGNQILLIYRYVNEVRNKLIKAKTEKLILTKIGTEEKGEGINYLVSTYRKQFPTKCLSPTRIRQSVLANLLSKGTDLRIVQVFAGHKKPSTTEKYRQTNLEQLKNSIQKYHPLG